jgi:hypothetical protein
MLLAGRTQPGRLGGGRTEQTANALRTSIASSARPLAPCTTSSSVGGGQPRSHRRTSLVKAQLVESITFDAISGALTWDALETALPDARNVLLEGYTTRPGQVRLASSVDHPGGAAGGSSCAPLRYERSEANCAGRGLHPQPSGVAAAGSDDAHQHQHLQQQ